MSFVGSLCGWSFKGDHKVRSVQAYACGTTGMFAVEALTQARSIQVAALEFRSTISSAEHQLGNGREGVVGLD